MSEVSVDAGQVRQEITGPVLRIVIDRPAKYNGFTPKMMRELGEAYTAFEDNASLRCAILCAEGKHFTAGLDLPTIAPLMRRGEPSVAPHLIDPCDLRPDVNGRRRSKPLVAAVHGITYTLGIELMLAADIVIAASDCRFSQLEVKRGIMATGGATVRIAERAGWGNAMLHLLTGDEFNADEALRMGLVQRVVAPEAVQAEALRIAEAIAAQAPLAVQASRANALVALEQGPAAAIAQFRDIQTRLSNSDDAREGVQSFIERRPARFAGK